MAIVALGVCLAGVVHADRKSEGTAKALQKKAMEEDYLASEFGKARTKLDSALGQCASCPPSLRARLLRDLGVVQIAAGDRAGGVERFVEAIKLDGGIALDADTRNKDLDAAFADAKARLAPPPDFVHTPAAEQRARTPLPIYVEYTGTHPVARVVVRYRGLGMTDFQDVVLTKDGKGYGGLVPCNDVGLGVVEYYLQGYNANNDVIANAGDRTHPFKVSIKSQAVAEPPHLPNQPPPAQCAEECPPGLPGCKKVAPPKEQREVGDVCEENVDCKNDRCVNGRCTDPPPLKVKNQLWIGVSGAVDYAFVPSADDACLLKTDATPVNDANYYCVRSDGVDYPSRTDASENGSIVATAGSGGADKVNGGGTFGNVRLLVSVDVALTQNLLVGGRLGLVLGGYPGAEASRDGNRWNAPLHAEARVTWVFGTDALSTPGLAPYVFAGGGVGQFEANVPVEVVETRDGASSTRNVDGWHLAGPGFVSIGGGGRYTIAPRWALMFGGRANLAFGNGVAPSVGPEVGGQVGF